VITQFMIKAEVEKILLSKTAEPADLVEIAV
jgi:hypothetical protein